jgi:apolipoprotein N-acyltransferase
MPGLAAPTPRTSTAALLAVLAGVLLSQAHLVSGLLAFPGVVAFGGALRLVARGPRARRRAALLGFVTQGLIGLHCWGFVAYGVPLYLAVVAYLALSGAAVGALGARGPVAAGLAWCGVELLHALGPVGFPLFLGGTQSHLPWRTALGVVGAAGVSGLLVAWGGAVVVGRRAVALATAALVGSALLGAWQPGLRVAERSVTVALVQGAVPNWLYGLAGPSPAARALVEHAYHGGAARAVASGAELVVLPETALRNSVVTRGERILSATLPAAPGSQAIVVMGAYRAPLDGERSESGSPGGDQRNSVVAFGADRPGALLGFVDKAIRVPFVESSYPAGARERLLSLAVARLGVLICYESMNPLLAGEADGAELLVIVTNDAGFEWAPVSVAHARQGWARSAELGRPLVRAAQSGISLLLDERARPLVAPTRRFEPAVVSAAVHPTVGWTWYSLVGRWLLWASLPLAGALELVASRRSRPRPPARAGS